jgi:hypothetical protein
MLHWTYLLVYDLLKIKAKYIKVLYNV